MTCIFRQESKKREQDGLSPAAMELLLKPFRNGFLLRSEIMNHAETASVKRKTRRAAGLDNVETIIQMVREYLPAPGTWLGGFQFLSPDALWGGTLDKKPEGSSFAAVAEDQWPDGGMLLMVLEDGRVHVGDLNGYYLVDYCAASFPQFMQIMKLYQKAVETTPCPEEAGWEEYEECCERAEQVLRQQVLEIDPTAIADVEGFWSTIIEEFGAGM